MTAEQPPTGHWTHVSRIDPDEAAFLDMHGFEIPRPTTTLHTPGICCDRDQLH
ncbi:hypothetical protein [Streptomyces sp. NRRL F-2664]|uniref:hypothetical protein n=1 Tax=Streptomyces sp. NRRL F-2664 TaxID=1463842 RepID=UPI000AC80CC0|nr:hypothetical protein [Streptomyces sp. NRRL F-2664]